MAKKSGAGRGKERALKEKREDKEKKEEYSNMIIDDVLQVLIV